MPIMKQLNTVSHLTNDDKLVGSRFASASEICSKAIMNSGLSKPMSDFGLIVMVRSQTTVLTETTERGL